MKALEAAEKNPLNRCFLHGEKIRCNLTFSTFMGVFIVKLTTLCSGYFIWRGEIYCCGTQSIIALGDVRVMKSNNQINIPEAREAMDQFKMEAAKDLAVPVPS